MGRFTNHQLISSVNHKKKKLFSGFDGTWNSLAPCLAEIFAISGLLPQHHFNGRKTIGQLGSSQLET
jgi:hypothetical protein